MLKGTSDFVEQSPARSGWREQGGAYRQRRWEGPTAGLASFLGGATIPTGYTSIDFDEDGELTTITVEYSVPAVNGIGDDNEHGLVHEYWESDGNDLETSLWGHPKVLAATSGWTNAEKASLRKAVEDILNGTTSGTFSGDLGSFIGRLALGTEAFIQPQYVLTHVRVVRVNSDLTVSHSDVAKYYTYSQLTTEEPSLLDQNLVASAGLTAWIWQKRAPKVKPTQDGLWELRQEWWGAKEWDSWVYDAKT